MSQHPLRTDWHDTVYTMRMAGARTRDIVAKTGYTTGGIGKVIANFRAKDVVFPAIADSSPMAGLKARDWPNAVHMNHVSGTMPNGNRRTCHSQNLADAIRGIESGGGTING